MTAVAVVFWVAAGLLVYAQVGYPLLLELLARLRRGRRVAAAAPDGAEPRCPSSSPRTTRRR